MENIIGNGENGLEEDLSHGAFRQVVLVEKRSMVFAKRHSPQRFYEMLVIWWEKVQVYSISRTLNF